MQAKELIDKKFVEVDEGTTISELLGKLKRTKTYNAVVSKSVKYKGTKYLGMIYRKWCLRGRFDVSKMKAGKLVTSVPRLKPETSIEETARLLETANVNCLPVIEDDKIIGLVHAKDVLDALKDKFKDLKVNEIAKLKPVVFKEDDPVGKAINFMKEKKLGHLPIVDLKNRLIGVLSSIDIIEKLMPWPQVRGFRMGTARAYGMFAFKKSNTKEKMDYLKLPVYNVMSSNIVSAGKTDPVAKIIDLINKNDVSSVIIADGGEPVGIITVKDLLRWLRRGD